MGGNVELMRPTPHVFALVVALTCVWGCGANPGWPLGHGFRPFYSSTPCFDNCGGDGSCQTLCTNGVGRNSGLGATQRPR
jgi:hypothetical protein